MITLALDSTGPWCSAALVNDAKILGSMSENIGRGHAERLAPMVQAVFAQADLKPENIDRIAVCTGPGSFTGLRVALAFARSFALPRKTPVLGISGLRALAAQIDPDNSRRVVAAANVRRGEICWAGYDKGIEISQPQTLPVKTAQDAIKKFDYDAIIGDGSDIIGLTSAGQTHVSAPVLGWLAQSLPPQDFPPEPLYSRPPDAKLPGGITP